MKKRIIIYLLINIIVFSITTNAYALSTRHHLINAVKDLISVVFAPLKGIFITGPQNIKNAYKYEVYGREKPEDRLTHKGRLFAFWRAPGEETKGIISGIVETVDYTGKVLWELISIFWGD